MVSPQRNPTFSSKSIIVIGAFILCALVATASSQRWPTIIPRRTTTRPTSRPRTTTTTTPRPTTTTTAKPYTFTKPESCKNPPPVSSTTTTTTAAPSSRSLGAGETRPKFGSCSLPKTGKQAMGKEVRWPNNTLIYKIDSDAFNPCQRDLIMAAMYEIANKTDSCIKFRPKTDSDFDYVEFVSTQETCVSSGVGFQGGYQSINLNAIVYYEGTYGDCFYSQDDGYQPGSGLAAHEIIHTLGFQHEHQRPDRNQSIVVNYENIDEDKRHNFDIPEGQTVIGPYDLTSIMHYGGTAFAKKDTKSMDPIQKGAKMGMGDFLTNTDVFKLKTYYGCP